MTSRRNAFSPLMAGTIGPKATEMFAGLWRAATPRITNIPATANSNAKTTIERSPNWRIFIGHSMASARRSSENASEPKKHATTAS